MRTLTFLATLLTAALLLAGWGGNDEAGVDGAAGGTPQVSGIAAGPGISIEEALASTSDEQLLVNGNLLAQDGEVRLCSALAESFPPQCGGASLMVEGLELEEVDGLVTEGAVSWTDRPIQLLGTVEDGLLAVGKNAAA
jgi:hypothetical protein